MNQSDYLYPWFFGAAIQEGDQRSSVVWASDDAVVTSQRSMFAIGDQYWYQQSLACWAILHAFLSSADFF